MFFILKWGLNFGPLASAPHIRITGVHLHNEFHILSEIPDNQLLHCLFCQSHNLNPAEGADSRPSLFTLIQMGPNDKLSILLRLSSCLAICLNFHLQRSLNPSCSTHFTLELSKANFSKRLLRQPIWLLCTLVCQSSVRIELTALTR